MIGCRDEADRDAVCEGEDCGEDDISGDTRCCGGRLFWREQMEPANRK